MHVSWKALMTGVALLCAAASHSAEFLDPDQAFVVSEPQVNSARELAVDWRIAPGYKLYRSSISVVSNDSGRPLGALVLPPSESVYDVGRQQQVEVYHDRLHATAALPKGQSGLAVTVTYQGCAEDGLCYPPQAKHFTVRLSQPTPSDALSSAQTPSTKARASDAGTTGVTAAASASQAATAGMEPLQPPSALASADDSLSVQRVLASGSWWRIGLAFFVFGLLLSFTPCVLPMVPILSSIIVGQNGVSRSRGFVLALAYSLGMALVYTGLGIAAGLLGEGLNAFMQQPWVLISFSLLLALMALSMFDVYQLQLPSRWQGGVQSASNRFQGGRLLSVFAMGALSALIVGPCVAAPLAGALLYISQSRDVWLGGFALFVMAMGMSVPLLLMGLSAGSLLPRAGAWMTQVKTVFGFMLLGVALWMLNPLMLGAARLWAWGSLLLLAAMFTPLFAVHTQDFAHRLGRAVGSVLLLVGGGLLVGAMQGHDRLLTPLQSTGQPEVQLGSAQAASAPVPLFERMRSGPALDAVLAQPGGPLLLDFYADWCTSCLEWEHTTFADARVIQSMQRWRRVQVDVTDNTEADRALLKRFHLFGPPGMVFVDARGNPLVNATLQGYLAPHEFINVLADRLKQVQIH